MQSEDGAERSGAEQNNESGETDEARIDRLDRINNENIEKNKKNGPEKIELLRDFLEME